MSNLSRLLRENDYSAFQEEFVTLLEDQVAVILEKVKKQITEERFSFENSLSEEDALDEARFKIVKLRIRKGKIQRRKKVSTDKNYTFRGGRLVRMSAKEKRNRRVAQRRGKIKRRAKASRIRLKQKKSNRRRKNLGAR